MTSQKMLLLIPPSLVPHVADTVKTVARGFELGTSSGGWPTLGEIRRLSTGYEHIAVTTNSRPESAVELLSVLTCGNISVPESASDSLKMTPGIVCADEPVPPELLSAFPVSLHLWIRRPQPTDLFRLDLTSVASLADSASVLEAAVDSQAICRAVTGAPTVNRWPAAGPGVCRLNRNVLRKAIHGITGALKIPPREQQCVASGLWLLWDCLDESHEISQTMEGKGSPRTADYWHGLMHRREPDAGNAAYWFCRVGVHPAFQILRDRLHDWMFQTDVPTAEATIVQNRLLKNRHFDPAAMIEFSKEAIQLPNSDVERAFRRVQYLEMLNLLAWSLQQDNL